MTPALRLDRRTRPIRAPRPLPPSGATVAYTSLLLSISRAMDREILRALECEGLLRLDESVPEIPDMSSRDLKRLLAAVRRRLAKLVSPGSLTGKLDQIAERVGRFSRTQWARQLDAAMGIKISDDPDLSDLADRFRDENVKRIVSLADEKIDRVRDVLRDAGPAARVETVTDRIQGELDVTESHARLIARTEVATLNARMSRARHEEAGIDSYTWSTSEDERVRESHQALDGKRFAYNAPPAIEGEGRHGPGEFPNCRCCALPIIEGVD